MVLSSFSSIAAYHNITVECIKTNDIPYLEYEVLEGDKEDMIIEQINGKLKLSINKVRSNKTRIAFKVFYQSLESIKSSTGSQIRLLDYEGNVLKINTDVGGSVEAEIKAVELYADCASGSTITLKGTVNKNILSSESGANLDAKLLLSSESHAICNSGAFIAVNCKELLTANCSSGGGIHYYGKPNKVNRKSTSGGEVKAMQ
jgi:hypothetical protein